MTTSPQISDSPQGDGSVQRIFSYAKVNLHLDILGLREDGFHLLEMVNAKISLCDEIICEITQQPGIQLTVSNPAVPAGAENTAYRAAALFLEQGGDSLGVKIHIEKKIPFGAGLGGGSSNAAAVLKALNRMSRSPLAHASLMRLGAQIGADVPFFLIDGFAHVTGVGERVEPIQSLEDFYPTKVWVVLCSPQVQVSTKEAYRLWDSAGAAVHQSAKSLKDAIKQGRADQLPHGLFNAFEPVIYRQYPPIKQAYQAFSKISNAAPLLSGSGSNLFTLTLDWQEAERTALGLQGKGYAAQVCRLLV